MICCWINARTVPSFFNLEYPHTRHDCTACHVYVCTVPSICSTQAAASRPNSWNRRINCRDTRTSYCAHCMQLIQTRLSISHGNLSDKTTIHPSFYDLVSRRRRCRLRLTVDEVQQSPQHKLLRRPSRPSVRPSIYPAAASVRLRAAAASHFLPVANETAVYRRDGKSPLCAFSPPVRCIVAAVALSARLPQTWRPTHKRMTSVPRFRDHSTRSFRPVVSISVPLVHRFSAVVAFWQIY
jgi:hypothetical protein